MLENQTELNWKSVARAVSSHRLQLLIANTIALLAVVANVPIPLLMPLLVDEVLLKQPGPLVAVIDGLSPAPWQGPVLYITALLLLTVVLRLAGLFLNSMQTYRFAVIAKEITFGIRRRLLQQLQRVSMAEFETLGAAKVSSHLVTDVNTLDDFIGSTVSRAIVSLLSLIGITAVLLWMHWPLALFILCINPAVIYFTVVLGKNVKQLKKKENRAFELFQLSLTETLDGILQIRASNKERHYFARIIDAAAGIKHSAAQHSWRSDVANRMSMGVFLVGFDAFRAISMLMVVFSDLSVGEMMAVFGYLWFMMGPVQDLLGIQYAFFSAHAAMERLNQFQRLEPEPRYPHTADPFSGKKTVSVRLENIRFRYGEGPLVLDNVDLHIRAGEKVALVGASGGGKSTLVQVMLGLYSPEQGMLYFDEIPVTKIGLDTVRSHVASVLQHPAMFNATVRENLCLGEDWPEEKLLHVLRIAQLESSLREWPNGLDTLIGRQGIRLSGGQRQRLAIARMLLGDPKVVILDEATSALDAETEYRLHSAMREFLQERTTVIIAHRLSAVKQADRVYVFEGGRISEQGGHEELLLRDGLYRRLYGQLQH